MGGKEVKRPTPQLVREYLDELCAYALSIGMTLEQYWDDDPTLILYFYKAEKLRSQRKNQELWIQGAYIYQALGCVAPMFNSLAKDHKPKPYLKEPFALSQEEEEERKYQRFKKQMIELSQIKREEKNNG